MTVQGQWPMHITHVESQKGLTAKFDCPRVHKKRLFMFGVLGLENFSLSILMMMSAPGKFAIYIYIWYDPISNFYYWLDFVGMNLDLLVDAKTNALFCADLHPAFVQYARCPPIQLIVCWIAFLGCNGFTWLAMSNQITLQCSFWRCTGSPYYMYNMAFPLSPKYIWNSDNCFQVHRMCVSWMPALHNGKYTYEPFSCAPGIWLLALGSDFTLEAGLQNQVVSHNEKGVATLK